MLDGKSIEQTDKMVYVGDLLTVDKRCEKEVKRRIALAKRAFHKMSRVLKSRNINMQTRKRILKCYIWSTLLYGSETWTLTKTMESQFEAFEIGMLRVSWNEHKTNEEVLKMANTTSSLLSIIKNRKYQYFVHVIRARSIQKL